MDVGTSSNDSSNVQTYFEGTTETIPETSVDSVDYISALDNCYAVLSDIRTLIFIGLVLAFSYTIVKDICMYVYNFLKEFMTDYRSR